MQHCGGRVIGMAVGIAAGTITVNDSDGADLNSDDLVNVIDDALIGLNYGKKA
jgi:hypothetical protein